MISIANWMIVTAIFSQLIVVSVIGLWGPLSERREMQPTGDSVLAMHSTHGATQNPRKPEQINNLNI
jgi:hypothetical protein